MCKNDMFPDAVYHVQLSLLRAHRGAVLQRREQWGIGRSGVRMGVSGKGFVCSFSPLADACLLCQVLSTTYQALCSSLLRRPCPCDSEVTVR